MRNVSSHPVRVPFIERSHGCTPAMIFEHLHFPRPWCPSLPVLQPTPTLNTRQHADLSAPISGPSVCSTRILAWRACACGSPRVWPLRRIGPRFYCAAGCVYPPPPLFPLTNAPPVRTLPVAVPQPLLRTLRVPRLRSHPFSAPRVPAHASVLARSHAPPRTLFSLKRPVVPFSLPSTPPRPRNVPPFLAPHPASTNTTLSQPLPCTHFILQPVNSKRC